VLIGPPHTDPGAHPMTTGDWIAVVAAVVVASVPVGVLLTWSVWRRGSGPRLVPALLTLHAGAVVVVGTIGAAAAARSWQLVDPDRREEAASALLDVSRIDGDQSLYALLVLLLVAVTGLLAVLLAQAARFAAGDDPGGRTIACAVLGLEIGVAGLGLAQVVTGETTALTWLGLGHLPVLIAAMVSCWPPHPADLPR
jgi:hypothetical protein